MKSTSGILIGLLIASLFSLSVDRRLEDHWLCVDGKGNTVWPTEESPQAISSQDVDIQYDMAGMTQVLIKNGRLIYINSESRDYNLTTTGTPEAHSRSSEGAAVTSEEINTLIELIEDSGFLDLNDSYGTTPDDRHYPVRISFKAGDIEKHVFYRSHPNYPAPKAFQQVEAALIELARGKFKIRKEVS